MIDLRTLVPLDEKTILDSVAKTGRLIVADEGRMHCGVASEIAAMVSEKGLDSLKASVARVARTDAPVAANQIQEELHLPHRGEDRLRRAPGRRRSSRRGGVAGRGAGGDLAMPLTRLDHVLVLTDDIEGTRDFYRDALGLEVGERPPLEFPGYWLYAAGVPCVHVADREAYTAHSEATGIPASPPARGHRRPRPPRLLGRRPRRGGGATRAQRGRGQAEHGPRDRDAPAVLR